ncbi:MAG: hypothetical protein ABH952_06340 [Candidatus Omnitrophota bacterium]
MNNLTRTIWFRLTAIILVNAFLCLDIAWAAVGSLKSLHTHLAPAIRLDNTENIENFTGYMGKRGMRR